MRGEYGWGARRGRGLGEGRGWQGRYGADAAYDDSGWQQDSGQGQERGYGHGNGWRHDANAYCDCQQQGKQVNPVVVTAIHPLSVASAAGCGYGGPDTVHPHSHRFRGGSDCGCRKGGFCGIVSHPRIKLSTAGST